MQVNPVDGNVAYSPSRIREAPTPESAGAAGMADSQGSLSSSATAATSSGASLRTQSISLSSSETSFSSRVSSLVAEFGPAVADEDLLRLLLLVLALELLSMLNGENGENGGTINFTSGSSEGSMQSFQITQNSSSVNYALSVYNQQSQSFTAPSPSGPVVEPGPADDPGRNLDLQA